MNREKERLKRFWWYAGGWHNAECDFIMDDRGVCNCKVKKNQKEINKAVQEICQQERERIISLPKYDLSKRGIDGEFYIKVEDIKTSNI